MLIIDDYIIILYKSKGNAKMKKKVFEGVRACLGAFDWFGDVFRV